MLVIALRILANLVLPAVLGAWGTHLASEGIEQVKTRKLTKIGIWTLVILAAGIAYGAEIVADQDHAREVAKAEADAAKDRADAAAKWADLQTQYANLQSQNEQFKAQLTIQPSLNLVRMSDGTGLLVVNAGTANVTLCSIQYGGPVLRLAPPIIDAPSRLGNTGVNIYTKSLRRALGKQGNDVKASAVFSVRCIDEHSKQYTFEFNLTTRIIGDQLSEVTFARKVLSVPKTELDRREAEAKQAKPKQPDK